MGKYTKVLNTNFKYIQFRRKQLDIIKHVLEENRDVCAVMFTGSGKSLCYQYPAVYSNKVSLVISPLISLANDQMIKMKQLNIPACCLNSSIGGKNKLMNNILNNKYRVVYTTPEFIVKNTDFLELLNDDELLVMIGIDEAHCISAWGHEFRVAYTKLNCLKQILPNVPIVALTATATGMVCRDIVESLNLPDPVIIKTTFNRTNLLIKVIAKTHISIDILPVVEQKEPTLIYCQTRKATEEISEFLRDNEIESESYHAGMDIMDRETVHQQFVDKEIDCVVATVAFGMGIDIPIRNVIHWGIPKDMESYYQEIGRAGRDGYNSTCYLFYAISDMNSNNYFINQITDVSYRNRMMKLATVMKNYVYSSECRRKYILSYFGEKYTKDNCKMCDVCLNEVEKFEYNFKREAEIVFNIVYATGNCYGCTMLINMIRGSKSVKIPVKFRKFKSYGAGNFHNNETWKNVFRIFINYEYIVEKSISGGHGSKLELTRKATDWIKYKMKGKENDVILSVPKDVYYMLTGEPNDSYKSGKVKKTSSQSNRTKLYEKTYSLYTEDNSLKDIARKLDVTIKTVEEHINKLYKLGYEIDLERVGFTDKIYKLISETIVELGYPEKLRMIKDNLPSKISYLQIKLAITKMDNEINSGGMVKKSNKKKKQDESSENELEPNYFVNKNTNDICIDNDLYEFIDG